jgi:hypothetical protein
MARGRMIVLLNNDVYVTERWLDQLLYCLNKSPEVAAVGPVTNYISGEQQIDVSYKGVSEMPKFAAAFNRSNPGKWHDTKRLVGFCILLRRSTFEQVGYLDEGYRVGNFEDDDWNVRLRLQGKKMKIAADTFVHHIGSVTIKALGQKQFNEVNEKNERLFAKKWGNRYESIRRSTELATSPHRAMDFFPTHIWIRNWSGKLYWLKHGVKHPLAAGIQNDYLMAHAIRLSVIELLQIPTGSEYTEAELAAIHTDQSSDGKVVMTEEGLLYQLDQGKKREIVSPYACTAWGLVVPESSDSSESWSEWPEGLPIVPPTRLKSEDL